MIVIATRPGAKNFLVVPYRYVYGVATVKATKSELGVYIIRHVAVAHSCHGDHCPPERVWDGLEEGILGARLGEVDGTREQHDTCKEEEG